MQDYSTPQNMAIVHIATKQCILDYGDVVQVSCGIIVVLSVRAFIHCRWVSTLKYPLDRGHAVRECEGEGWRRGRSTSSTVGAQVDGVGRTFDIQFLSPFDLL